jgi:hypothetical protein
MDGIRRKEHDTAPHQIMTNEKRGKENKEDRLQKNSGQPI